MAKKISIFLTALMVLTLFTAVAIAAVNGAICDNCGNGEMRYWYTTYTVSGKASCSHGLSGFDSVEREYRESHTQCTYCGDGETSTTLIGTTITGCLSPDRPNPID